MYIATFSPYALIGSRRCKHQEVGIAIYVFNRISGRAFSGDLSQHLLFDIVFKGILRHAFSVFFRAVTIVVFSVVITLTIVVIERSSVIRLRVLAFGSVVEAHRKGPRAGGWDVVGFFVFVVSLAVVSLAVVVVLLLIVFAVVLSAQS